MKALSLDLRRRIVDAYHAAEGSVRELARRFKVAPNTVENQLKLERETGGIAPRAHRGGPPRKLTDEGVQELRALVEEKNDRTLAELVDLMAERHQVRVGEATISRALHDKLGMTRKKNSTCERAGPARHPARPRGLPGVAPDDGPPSTDLLRRVRQSSRRDAALRAGS